MAWRKTGTVACRLLAAGARAVLPAFRRSGDLPAPADAAQGGLYQWASCFNQTVGFMLAWNLVALRVIVFMLEIGLQRATLSLSYAIGPSAAWIDEQHLVRGASGSSALLRSFMVVTSTIGLSVGKWVHNTGGIFMITIFGAVVLLPVIGLLTGMLPIPRFLSHAPSGVFALQPEHPR